MCKTSSILPKVTEGFLYPRVLFKVMCIPMPPKNLTTWYVVHSIFNRFAKNRNTRVSTN